MIIPPPYRPATLPAIGFGAAVFKQGDLRLSSVSTLKKTEFCMGFVQFCTARNPSWTFCTIAHCTSRQTLHHTNSALVGGRPKKMEFCMDYVEFQGLFLVPFGARPALPFSLSPYLPLTHSLRPWRLCGSFPSFPPVTNHQSPVTSPKSQASHAASAYRFSISRMGLKWARLVLWES